MKLKGLTNLKKDTEKMQERIQKKIDEMDWDTLNAEEKDSMYNDAFDALSEITERIEEIEELNIFDY